MVFGAATLSVNVLCYYYSTVFWKKQEVFEKNAPLYNWERGGRQLVEKPRFLAWPPPPPPFGGTSPASGGGLYCGAFGPCTPIGAAGGELCVITF